MPSSTLLRPALLIPLVAILASGCDIAVWGNGDAASEERSLARFTAIEVGTAIDVELEVVASDGPPERTHEGSTTATLRCDSNLIDRIETVVEDGTLRVRPTDDDDDLRPRTDCVLTLTTERLESISIEGPGTIVAHGDLEGLSRIALEGPAELDAEGIASDALDVRVEGPSELALAGAIDHLDASLSGPVELDAKELDARAVELDAEGPVEASVRASEHCALDLDGPVEVDVYGDPDTRDVDVDGPAEVDFR